MLLLYFEFYVLLIEIGTFEVTSQYFAYFISISSLVFENDKWTFWGYFGHFNMSHLLNFSFPLLQVNTRITNITYSLVCLKGRVATKDS